MEGGCGDVARVGRDGGNVIYKMNCVFFALLSLLVNQLVDLFAVG